MVIDGLGHLNNLLAHLLIHSLSWDGRGRWGVFSLEGSGGAAGEKADTGLGPPCTQCRALLAGCGDLQLAPSGKQEGHSFSSLQ